MYNNPFIYQSLYRPSLFARLFGNARTLGSVSSKLNWANILSNTQKSLGVINQAIPLVHQVKPIINNAKTMFKVANILKDNKDNKSNNNNYNNINTNNYDSTNKPIFFM